MAKKRAASKAPPAYEHQHQHQDAVQAPPSPAASSTLQGSSSEHQPGDAWEDVDADDLEDLGDEDELEFEFDAEGVQEPEVARQTGRRERGGSAGPGIATPRRRIVRRPKTKIAVPIASPRRQTSKRPAPALASTAAPSTTSTLLNQIPTDELAEHARTGLRFTLRYFITVFGRAISLLKFPLSILLGFYLFALLLNRAAPTLHRTFAPVCRLPFASSLTLCAPPPPAQVRWADFPALEKVQTASLDQLLENAAGGPALALELKRAEMATGDLAVLVRASDMPAREALAGLLNEFVTDAREAGRGLHRLSAKIGGTVDTIMAVNDHALQTISEAHTRASAPRTLSEQALALLPWVRPPDTHALVSNTFSDAMSTLASQLARLILEAELNIAQLTALEERLHTLHALASTEDAALSGAEEELLAKLWTHVGGNARERRRLGGHRALLGDLGAYRRRARVHVVAALQTLLALGGDVEEMRERVSAPELLGDRIPVQVHMRSIQAGLERLRESRVHAKRVEEDTVRRVLEIED
ncbi:hypothetical protein BD779DRAFT_1639532 [Infundibulicybe gibba]|nr:hypothetical protein BD779DRAFT_1639532 [Infundibulicybe gibba]